MSENSWFWAVVAGSLILGISIIVAAVLGVMLKRRREALEERKARENAEKPAAED